MSNETNNETPVNETAPENTAGQTEATDAGNVNAEQETTTTTRKRAPRDTFMEVWETVVVEIQDGLKVQSGIEEVSRRLEELGYSAKPNSVQQRSTHYRRDFGLELSNMPRGGGARFNATEANSSLAAIKAKLAEKKATTEQASAGEGKTEADATDES
jgi:hypothetical protein